MIPFRDLFGFAVWLGGACGNPLQLHLYVMRGLDAIVGIFFQARFHDVV